MSWKTVNLPFGNSWWEVNVVSGSKIMISDFCPISNLIIYSENDNCQGNENSKGHFWSLRMLLAVWFSEQGEWWGELHNQYYQEGKGALPPRFPKIMDLILPQNSYMDSIFLYDSY